MWDQRSEGNWRRFLVQCSDWEEREEREGRENNKDIVLAGKDD